MYNIPLLTSCVFKYVSDMRITSHHARTIIYILILYGRTLSLALCGWKKSIWFYVRNEPYKIKIIIIIISSCVRYIKIFSLKQNVTSARNIFFPAKTFSLFCFVDRIIFENQPNQFWVFSFAHCVTIRVYYVLNVWRTIRQILTTSSRRI